ncbi:TPM domain-containing protein [Heyndrickxia ginsengihumi]|uniref:TPM domain-containing protein n=1 Tax=Heyndrickxia ginsengihumi TaxID=363870 RepID=UPI003D223A03
MRKQLILFTSITLLIVSFIVGMGREAEAKNADIPSPVGDIYVQDFAHVLTEQQKNELIHLGRQLDDKTKAQIAVLTVESLQNKTIEEYANQAFRKYRLGDQKLNNGVLLLVAVKDKSVRIEVGYGLEGALPDGKVGRILDDYTIPYLKENKPSAAVINTYKQLFNVVAQEYHINKKTDAKAYVASKHSMWLQIGIAVLIIILIILDNKFFGGTFTFMIINILSIFLRNGGGSGGNRKGGGGSSGGGGASRNW